MWFRHPAENYWQSNKIIEAQLLHMKIHMENRNTMIISIQKKMYICMHKMFYFFIGIDKFISTMWLNFT